MRNAVLLLPAMLALTSCGAPRVYQAPPGSPTALFTLKGNEKFMSVTAVIYDDAQRCTGFAQIQPTATPAGQDKVVALEAGRKHSVGVHLPINTRMTGYQQVTFTTCNHYITFPVVANMEYRYVTDIAGDTCLRRLEYKSPSGNDWRAAPFSLRTLNERYRSDPSEPVCLPE